MPTQIITRDSDCLKEEIKASETDSTLDCSFYTESETIDSNTPYLSSKCTLKEKEWDIFKIQNLEPKMIISEGAQGEIQLVIDTKNGQKYAQKIYRHRNHGNHRNGKLLIEFEKEVGILMELNHPFIIKFYTSYILDQNKHCLLLEFCQGGDLKFHMNRIKDTGKSKFSEKTIKFYIACVVLALENIHQHKIIYRDLKPENILIDNYGYPRI